MPYSLIVFQFFGYFYKECFYSFFCIKFVVVFLFLEKVKECTHIQ